jgi:hypothetical protein
MGAAMIFDVEKLKHGVAQAFSGRAYPGDDKIAETRPWIPEYEGNRVARYFRGKRWQDLSYDKLRKEYPADPTACMHFMLDEGFLGGISIVSLFALLTVVRSAHQAQIDLSLPNGGDPGAAMLRVVTVVLVLPIVGKAIYLYKQAARPNVSSGKIFGSSG